MNSLPPPLLILLLLLVAAPLERRLQLAAGRRPSGAEARSATLRKRPEGLWSEPLVVVDVVGLLLLLLLILFTSSKFTSITEVRQSRVKRRYAIGSTYSGTALIRAVYSEGTLRPSPTNLRSPSRLLPPFIINILLLHGQSYKMRGLN